MADCRPCVNIMYELMESIADLDKKILGVHEAYWAQDRIDRIPELLMGVGDACGVRGALEASERLTKASGTLSDNVISMRAMMQAQSEAGRKFGRTSQILESMRNP